MKSLRLVVPIAVATTLAFAAATGCGGGSKHTSAPVSPTPTPTPAVTPVPGSVVEVEPNDDPAHATAISGSGMKTFFGVCSSSNDIDVFSFVSGTGAMAAQITWTEGTTFDDLDLFAYDASGVQVLSDSAVPPNDSPANVTGTFTTSGTISVDVEIDCFNTTPNVAYFGTVTIP